jgi:uncharacterized low-complexity protein
MATSISAFKIPAGQPPAKRPKSDAERAKAYRARKKAEASAPPSAEYLIPLDAPSPAEIEPTPKSVNLADLPVPPVTSSRPPIASMVLVAAAIGLAGVGVTINAWFARSLGSTDAAGWLFLAVGVASDLAALVLPAVCARAWAAKQRGAALAGWAVWAVAFAFAITASVGFTSLNVTAVTQARAEIVTPAVTVAKLALGDAIASRNRECATGTGKVCRIREDAVVDRQGALDQAMRDVAGRTDPQAEAAVRLAAWASMGAIRPTGDDFGILRLMLLAFLPQAGGLLVMVARAGSHPSQAVEAMALRPRA